MAHWLRKLKLKELSFVDRPANQHARVVLFKRAEEVEPLAVEIAKCYCCPPQDAADYAAKSFGEIFTANVACDQRDKIWKEVGPAIYALECSLRTTAQDLSKSSDEKQTLMTTAVGEFLNAVRGKWPDVDVALTKSFVKNDGEEDCDDEDDAEVEAATERLNRKIKKFEEAFAKAGFDESKHPRKPKGTSGGGQFRSSTGEKFSYEGGTEGSRRAVGAIAFTEGKKISDLRADMRSQGVGPADHEEVIAGYKSAKEDHLTSTTSFADPSTQETSVQAKRRIRRDAVREYKSGGAKVRKRNFSSDQRQRLADKGQALPDGSFPIANVSDLHNAIRAIGRAKNPTAAKAHIKRRARALGATDALPDGWGGGKSLTKRVAELQARVTELSKTAEAIS